jgi:hypothetical protein
MMGDHPMSQSESSGVLLSRALKLAGETIAPGASLLLDGKVGVGALHFIGGTLARMAFGPLGVLLVAANSYSTSVTGKSLATNLQEVAGGGPSTAPADAVDNPAA